MAGGTDAFIGIDPVEIYSCLRIREVAVPEFVCQSPQIQHRDWLVEWMSATCEKFSLSTTCLHLSVLILDLFMDNFEIDNHQLYLLAISCIQISGKSMMVIWFYVQHLLT